MIICSAKAGVIGLGSYDGHGYLAAAPVAVAPPIAVAHAPAVAVAHAPAVAVAHGATSWQNNNLLALNPTAVVTKVAAPVAIAAPVVAKVAAPVAYAPAPWALGLGKGVGFGYH
ncbi:cuticle protein 70, isoforms A and B-like isoform X2 [Diorhabda carinulata]|nr:cuticle protein 70, isoforms A and B-like isoform X2 [Diorhabda carinulata]